MLCAARFSFPKADQYVAPGFWGLLLMNLPPNNYNAVMLDQPSGSPDAYQVQQAIQQQAKREEVDAGMTRLSVSMRSWTWLALVCMQQRLKIRQEQ